MWPNSKTPILTKQKNLILTIINFKLKKKCVRTTWHLKQWWDVLCRVFCYLAMFFLITKLFQNNFFDHKTPLPWSPPTIQNPPPSSGQISSPSSPSAVWVCSLNRWDAQPLSALVHEMICSCIFYCVHHTY